MSKDSKRRKKGTVSEHSRRKTSTASNNSKPIEQSTASNNSKPTEQGTASDNSTRTEQGTALNESRPIGPGTAGEMPFFDLTELMSQFRLPGVDFAALVDREQKNIQALAEANRIAFEGSHRLIHRQAEILLETMKKVIADAGRVDAMSRMELAQEGFEKALANMRELAEMGSKYQREAFEVVRKRIEENMEGIRNSGKKVGE
ncbi:phasin family protein [Bradyrhizobium sp.]|uniref:phasin family protein n=1 Tax=Bradyrhizobium sp. TaxID=376 RepID=UPI000A044224|nr:TIGR01841 family phasin [Bradyrhizobium sp.]